MGSCKSRFYDEGSDLWFGDFNESDYFRIEECDYYKRVLKHESIKAVDCVLCRRSDSGMHIVFVEAKKNLYYGGKGYENKTSHIAKQFMDSLHLICGSWFSGEDAKINLPGGFAQYYQHHGQIVFTLVVKNCPKDELLLIEDALVAILKRENLIWNIKIRAYDEELATEKSILVPQNSRGVLYDR